MKKVMKRETNGVYIGRCKFHTEYVDSRISVYASLSFCIN